MKLEDVKVGMKVVPHSKTVKGHCSFSACKLWSHRKHLMSPFLIVESFDAVHGFVWLSDNPSASTVAVAAYNASDFEPYVEELPSETLSPDNVNSPAHYTAGGIECYDALAAATVDLQGEECGCTWNAIKYLWRWKRKNGVEDLKKAQWYINRLIEKLEN